jgi:hypothetical protein
MCEHKEAGVRDQGSRSRGNEELRMNMEEGKEKITNYWHDD